MTGPHRVLAAAAVAVLAVGAAGCVSYPWDVEGLTERHPELASLSRHRLADVTPYILPVRASAVFFLCRWDTDEPVPVSLPPDATEEEREGFDKVLRAWEGAGLGVRFATDPPPPPRTGIEVRFIEPPDGTESLVQSANTITDCAIDPEGLTGEFESTVPARLAFASIHMWRGGYDAAGRKVPHSNAEFLGSALHEFGHALGFQGHASVGRSVMVRETDVSRRSGSSLAKGKPFADDTLRALYTVPNGTVVKRVPVPAARTHRLERMVDIAAERDLVGPYARVGDIDGQVAWRSEPAGVEYALRIYGVRAVLRDPNKLWLSPTLSSSRLLDEVN